MTPSFAMKTAAQSASASASDPAKARELSAALDLLWTRFLPEIRQRADQLEDAAAALAANTLSTAQREAAHHVAHNLAGTLGTFNLTRGTELAREFELLFSGEVAPANTIAGHLAAIARELRTIVDSRK